MRDKMGIVRGRGNYSINTGEIFRFQNLGLSNFIKHIFFKQLPKTRGKRGIRGEGECNRTVPTNSYNNQSKLIGIFTPIEARELKSSTQLFPVRGGGRPKTNSK
jgi:hypothetical protein